VPQFALTAGILDLIWDSKKVQLLLFSPVVLLWTAGNYGKVLVAPKCPSLLDVPNSSSRSQKDAGTTSRLERFLGHSFNLIGSDNAWLNTVDLKYLSFEYKDCT
jgi:hypothetical protein